MDTVVRDTVAPYLERTPEDDRPIVLMTCGIAGAGKTTLSKAVLSYKPDFHRLSMDEIIHQKHGIYGVDYQASTELYAQYLEEADIIYLSNFRDLLEKKENIIVEKSFYAKEDRDEYRKMAEEGGARVVLVFLKARDREVLWQRICKRSAAQKTANSAFDISRETFEMYWDGFEDPVGEGEILVEVV